MSQAGNDRYYNPTEIRWIPWQQIGELLPSEKTRILVILGRSSMRKQAEALQSEILKDYEVKLLSGISPDPSILSVNSVLKTVRELRPDWVIALGGGSVLDTAKTASLLASHPGAVQDYLRRERKVKYPGIPVIAVPTTAGTGSEVTPYASITDHERMTKISLSHDYLFPRYAVLDPQLIYSLPAKQMAISGMDALSHAIEGYWAKAATPVTDAIALRAISIILGNLETAVRHSKEIAARKAMLNGSNLAGLVISNARTTAVHAASYPLTVHFGVPHGMACGFLLPGFIEYNGPSLEAEKRSALLRCAQAESMPGLAAVVRELRRRIGLPEKLREVGVTDQDIDTIVAGGFRPDRVGNNPRKVTEPALRKLLKEVL